MNQTENKNSKLGSGNEINFFLNLLVKFPTDELIKVVKDRENAVKKYEPYILGQINDTAIEKLILIQDLGIETLFNELDELANKTGIPQLLILNTVEGREFIKINFNEIDTIIG